MNKLCLDTSAYSHFKRGHPGAVEFIDAAEWVGLSTIVLGELRTGFALGSRQRENERQLAAFLRNPVVHALDVDDAASRIYSEIVVSLRRTGTPLPSNDIWIAAVAAREGAMVITFDAHFHSMERISSHVL